MQENPNVIMSVNTEDYDERILKNLTGIYRNCNIFVSVMGSKSEKIKHLLPKEIKKVIYLKAPFYNYALSTNVLLKSLYSEINENSTVILVDSKTAFSPTQVLNFDCKNVDFNKKFITVAVLIDTGKTKLSLTEKRASLTISKRVSWLEKNEHSFFIPAIICKLDNIISLEHGLEESIFNEQSRQHCINQLNKIGLKEVKTKKQKGLYLGEMKTPSKQELNDRKILSDYTDKLKSVVFIPSNYNQLWGNAGNIINITPDNGILKWNQKLKGMPKSLPRVKDRDNLTTIEVKEFKVKTFYEIPETKPEPKVEPKPIYQPKPKPIHKPKPIKVIEGDDKKVVIEPEVKYVSKRCETKLNVLLVVNAVVKHVVSVLPLIKALYKEHGRIDILTNNKLDPSVSLLKTFMTNKIFDVNDLTSGLVNTHKYNTVMPTIGSMIKLPPELTKIKHKSKPIDYTFLPERNYSLFDPEIKAGIPEPICNFRRNKLSIPENTIMISGSVEKLLSKKEKWNRFKVLVNKLANNKSVNVYIALMQNEKADFNTEDLNLYKNIKVLTVGNLDAAGIVKEANLVITHPNTNLAWIAYASKTQTLLIEKQVSEIPSTSSLTKFVLEGMNDNHAFNYIYDKVWEMY